MTQASVQQQAVTAPAQGRSAARRRLAAVALLVLSGGTLALAACLSPDPQGVGTHTQLNLPPCGFLLQTGIPCATCGMTTAFAHAAHGHLLAAFYVQPAGALIALLTAMAAIVSAYALAVGLDLAPLIRRVATPRTFLALGLVIVAAWAYKIILITGGLS